MAAQNQRQFEIAFGEDIEITDGADVTEATFACTLGQIECYVTSGSVADPAAGRWPLAAGEGNRALTLSELSAIGGRIRAVGRAYPHSKVTITHA